MRSRAHSRHGSHDPFWQRDHEAAARHDKRILGDIPQDQQQGETSMTAIGFSIAPQAAAHGPRYPHSRDASASVAVAAASHVELFKFASTIVLLGIVAAGIVALKSAIWMPHFNH
jgi:hypothetical protein